ncbi:permease [Novipirellula artificiosorum]|uniref:Putative permease n=1 Tax=Novipirellula artificiosorum TaxID=2528016 RepID=A0A5C6DTV9_9BACT|nr:permease [Novipirellula artificiosorum]TWU38209.1 putative permease [Novipirellula artificiosorum]
MNTKQLSILASLVGVFLFAYYVNFTSPEIQNAIHEAFYLLQWYVRYHTLACVVPAMFIAGAISVFFSKEAVLRHLGPNANKAEAYGVASISGTVLAVCSCSVLPMFAGIYRVGAGLGPASAFLYAGPAINVMAIFLTARVLGFDLGIARIIGSIVFAVIIGLIMSFLFRSDEEERTAAVMQLPDPPPAKRKFWQTSLFFVCMILFLVFSDWANPSQTEIVKTDGTKINASVLIRTAQIYRVQLQEPLGDLPKGAKLLLDVKEISSEKDLTPENYKWVAWIYHHRWYFAGALFLAVLAMSWGWFDRQELADWMAETWSFSKSIIPLLFGGVLLTGFVGALIPEEIVASWVGGDSFRANLVASMIGGMWYFATLTEIPILEALLGLGMGRGPALSLLLAGPALSLPSIAVIYSVIGFKKTLTFVALTIVMSTAVGMIFGWFFV